MKSLLALLLVACTSTAPQAHHGKEVMLPAPDVSYAAPEPAPVDRCETLLDGQPCCAALCAGDVEAATANNCVPPPGTCLLMICESADHPIIWGAKVCTSATQ